MPFEGHDVVFILQFSTEHNRLQRLLALSTGGSKSWKSDGIQDTHFEHTGNCSIWYFVNYMQTIIFLSIDVYLSTGIERRGVSGRSIDSSVLTSGSTLEIRQQERRHSGRTVPAAAPSCLSPVVRGQGICTCKCILVCTGFTIACINSANSLQWCHMEVTAPNSQANRLFF